MIRIAITQAAFDAIAATLPLGSVSYEAEANDRGQRLIWLPRAVVNKLAAMRGAGGELFGSASCGLRRLSAGHRRSPQNRD